MATLFTKIINGDIPGKFAWSDEVCVAFASIAPISPGHLLVVPRVEISKFTDADDDLLAHLMRVAAAIGRAQEAAFDAPRAAVIISGFEVPHLHVHVIPAWGEAELSFANADSAATADDLAAATERVRAELHAQGQGEFVPAELGSSARGADR